MSPIAKQFAAVLLWAASFEARSGEQVYSCDAVARYQLDASGALRVLERLDPPVATAFIVVRDTGRVQRSGFAPLAGFRDREAKVLSRGNAENSFVATYSSDRAVSGVRFGSLKVKEFVSGANKPFILTDGDTVVTGICK